jgi:hypothetical protein
VIRVKDREISDLLEAIAENRTEGVKSGSCLEQCLSTEVWLTRDNE